MCALLTKEQALFQASKGMWGDSGVSGSSFQDLPGSLQLIRHSFLPKTGQWYPSLALLCCWRLEKQFRQRSQLGVQTRDGGYLTESLYAFVYKNFKTNPKKLVGAAGLND